MRGDLNTLTLGELYDREQRESLDRVIRSICIELDCSYVEGLDALRTWASAAAAQQPSSRERGTQRVTLQLRDGTELAGRLQGDTGPEGVQLAAIIRESPISLHQFEIDAERLAADAANSERVIAKAADSDGLPQPEGEVRDGRVILSEDTDVAHLLTDPYTRESRWQRARELSDFYRDNREAFEGDDRVWLEAGRDLCATLEHERREVELADKRVRVQRAQAARERNEAKSRAKKRRERRR